MTTYSDSPSSFSRLLMVFVVLIIVVVGAAWFNSHHNDHRTLGQKVGDVVGNTIDAIPTTVSKAANDLGDKQKLPQVSGSSSVNGDLKSAGAAASSALSKTSIAASSALSEASEDIKAAAAKQKEQDRAAGRNTTN